MLKTFALGLAVLAPLSLPVTARAQSTPVTPVTIVARGEATVKKQPDQAWITVATSVTAAKPDDARAQSAQMMTSVITQLKSTGLAADAIRTLGFSLSPMYSTSNNNAPRITTYAAHNSVEVRVDDLDKLATVIDTIMAPKNSGLSIEGPRFELKDRAAAEAEALGLAVRNGLARANAMARGNQLRVDGVSKIEEDGISSGQPPTPMFRTAMASAAPTPIEVGAIEVTAAVVVTATAVR